MVIRASSAGEVQRLVDDLGSRRTAARDAAVARLTVVGARAVDRLIQLVTSDETPTARIGALRALEGIADPRAIDCVLAASRSSDAAVAAAAVAAAGTFLESARGAEVVDCLTAQAMDTARDESVRLAALHVLLQLKRSTIAPLLQALQTDAHAAIRAAALLRSEIGDGEAIERAAEALPDDADVLLRAVDGAGAAAAPGVLLRLIERLREREADEEPAARAPWTRVRGRVHLVLAQAGSRVALYDLRESIAGTTSPLPLDFLSALSEIGDTSCLEPIADACGRPLAAGGRDEWWHAHLVDAFRAIAARDGVTRRNAVMKKIHKRWPAFTTELAGERSPR